MPYRFWWMFCIVWTLSACQFYDEWRANVHADLTAMRAWMNHASQALRPTAIPVLPVTATPTAGVGVVVATTPTPAQPALQGSRAHPYVMSTPWQNADWHITVTEFLVGADAVTTITTTNQFNPVPPAEYTYAIVTLTVTNLTGNPNTTFDPQSDIRLWLTGSHHVRYMPASVVAPQPLTHDIFGGAQSTGQLVYRVRADETHFMLAIQDGWQGPATHITFAPQTSIVPDWSNSQATTSNGTQRSRPAPLGKPVIADGIAIRVQNVIRGTPAWQRVQQANRYNKPPPDGYEYVCIELEIRFLGDRADADATISPMMVAMMTTTMNALGETYPDPAIVDPDPSLDMAQVAGLYAGGITTGWIVRMAPRDAVDVHLLYTVDWQGTYRFLRLE